MIKPKSIMDFIREDPSLSEKITYEEFLERQQRGHMEDDFPIIKEAYEAYKRTMQELGVEV